MHSFGILNFMFRFFKCRVSLFQWSVDILFNLRIHSCNKVSDLIAIWSLAIFKFHSYFPSCSIIGQRDEKNSDSPFLHTSGKFKPHTRYIPVSALTHSPYSSPPPNHTQNQSLHPFLCSSHLGSCWGDFPTPFRESHVQNKFLHTLLGVCCHPSPSKANFV